ncbi:MAG TPA: polymer-forming cytoskeletal protein [Tepidisphaeraceae bacterium]|nr:polymer-forming cytoskeletal protein [Tepidisphaeraceae bacterium]
MAAGDRNLPSSPQSDDRLTIVCYHCGKPQDVSRKAQSLTCKFCYKPLKLKDEAIQKYDARRSLETVGVITVEKRGNVVVQDRIVCGGLIVRGKVKGKVVSRGPVLVGPEAEIKGDVTAPSLAVGAGAVLEGQYAIGPQKGHTPQPPPDDVEDDDREDAA